MFHFLPLLSIFVRFSQGSLCVSFLNHSTCGNSSKWAVNTPYVIATHDFTPVEIPSFNTFYYLNSVLACQFTYFSAGTCSLPNGPNCVTCLNNYTSDRTIVGSINVTGLNLSNTGTILTYDLDKADISGVKLHTFTYSECPLHVGNATAQNDSTPCGYGCSSQFVCLGGFKHNPNMDMSMKYVCSATAEWNPSVPLDLCVPEPTTAETTTTPTSPTTSNGSTQDAIMTYTTTGSTPTGDGRSFPNSGPSFAAIGGVLAAICIGVFVYMTCTEIPINVVLYIMFAICICLWAVALGLCFGLSTNKSAVIAGIVLGSLELAGMVVVIVFQFLHIKSLKRKGIPGKPEDPSL